MPKLSLKKKFLMSDTYFVDNEKLKFVNNFYLFLEGGGIQKN